MPSPTLAAAASGNIEAFAGTHVVGTIPVPQSVINEALGDGIAQARGRVKNLEFRIGADNRIECGVQVAVGPFAKWFRPQFLISPRVITERGPRIELTVASAEYLGLMWIAQIFASEYLPHGLTVDGRNIVVDLAAIPQMSRLKPFLPYLRQLNLRTKPGRIEIDFEVKVDESK